MIKVDGLVKRFGAVTALDGVSFEAQDARITGLLGPNGAGKSTCLRVLYTALKPDQGSAHIGGHDVVSAAQAVRREIGVLPHSAGLYPHLTSRENIAYYGQLHGLELAPLQRRIDELSELLELQDIIDRRGKGFSQGQRTKVALARALVHSPRHLLLDEPSNGLDVMATRSLRMLLGRLRDEGHCIIFSSHVMGEVASLCDDLVIIAAGKVALKGTPADLTAQASGSDLEELFINAVTAVTP
jgi:sodium transport system ATP-binding protein